MNSLLLFLVVIAAVDSVQSRSAPTKPLSFSWSPTEQRVGSSRSSLREADFLGDHLATASPPVAPMRTVHGDWILGGGSGSLEEGHEEGRHSTTTTIALDLNVAMSGRESPEGDVASLGCFMRRFAAHQGEDHPPQDFEAAVRRSTPTEPYRLTLNSSAVLDRCRLVFLRPPSFENVKHQQRHEKPQSESDDEVQIEGEDVLPSFDSKGDQDWWSKWRDKIVPQGSMMWLLQWNHDNQAAPRSGGSPAEEGTRRHIGTMLWTVHALSERAREGEGVWFGEYGAEIRCENLFHCDTEDDNKDDEDRSMVREGKMLSSHGAAQDGSRQPDHEEESLRIPLRSSVAVLQLVDTTGNFLPSFASSSAATGGTTTATRAASVTPSLMGGTRRRRGGGFSAPPVPTMVERSLAADTPDRRTATPFQGILRDDSDDCESGTTASTAVVDAEEREVRRRGLLWRLSLTNDVFGPFLNNETNTKSSYDSMSAGNLALRSAAFVEMTQLLSRLVCSPLPCLHQNPFLMNSFEVGVPRAKRQPISPSSSLSSLSLGAPRFLRHIDGAATTATQRRGALRLHHSSAAAFAILHRALSQVAPLNESTFTDGEARKRWRAAFWEAVARGWREAGGDANATRTGAPSSDESSSLLHGMLRRVVVPQDFRVTPSVIHLFIPPRELERRGFSLPAFPRDVVAFLQPFLIADRTTTLRTTTSTVKNERSTTTRDEDEDGDASDEDVIRSEAHSWSARVLREHLNEELKAFAMYMEGRSEDASASSSSKRLHRLLGGGVDLRGLDNEWNREVALVQQRRRRRTTQRVEEGSDLTVDEEKEDSDTDLQQAADEVSRAQQLTAVGLYRLSLTPFEVIADRSSGGGGGSSRDDSRRDVVQPLCRKEQFCQAAAQRPDHRTKEDRAEGCPSAECSSRLLHGGNGRGTSMILGASYVLPREYFPVTYKLRWMIGENEEARLSSRTTANEDKEEPLCVADECRADCSTAVTETAAAGSSCLQEGDIAEVDGVVGLKGGRRKASGEQTVGKKMRVTMTMSKWCAMQPASPLPPPPPPPRSAAAKDSEPPRCPRALLFQGHSGLHPLSGFSAAAHGTCEERRDILRNLAFLTCPPDDDLEEESEGEAQQQPTTERGVDVLPHRQSDEEQQINNSAAFRRCEDYYGGAETFSQLAWFVAEHWVQGLYVPPTQPRSLWVSFGSSSSPPQTAEYDAVSEAHHCGDAALEIDEETSIGDRNGTAHTTTTTTTTMVEARRNRKQREAVTTAAWIAFRKPIFVTIRLPMGVVRHHGGLPVLVRDTDDKLDDKEEVEVEPSLVRILP